MHKLRQAARNEAWYTVDEGEPNFNPFAKARHPSRRRKRETPENGGLHRVQSEGDYLNSAERSRKSMYERSKTQPEETATSRKDASDNVVDDQHKGKSQDVTQFIDLAPRFANPELQENSQGGVHTDSGYASANNKSRAQTQDVPSKADQTSLEKMEHQSGTAAHQDEILSITVDDHQADTELDESRTIYSDASSVGVVRKESYIAELADDLFNKVCPPRERDVEVMKRISEILPELLKAFALKLGYDAKGKVHRDIMYFVHKNRRKILDSFEQKYHNEEDISRRHLDRMPLADVMMRWFTNMESAGEPSSPEAPPDHSTNDSTEIHLEEIEEDVELPGLDEYRSLINKTAAYDWLLGRLQREFFMAPGCADAMQEIGARVSALFPTSYKVSKRTAPPAQRVVYEFDVDLRAFFKSQDFDETPAEVMEKVITITGNKGCTQALPCAQYLQQTWPSTASKVLEITKSVMEGPDGETHTRILPDGTRLQARIEASKLIANTVGPGHSVIEIGEQLAWLSTALQCSPYDLGVTYCRPSITDINTNEYEDYGDTEGIPSVEIVCRISYAFERQTGAVDLSHGQCWQGMFGNPVVVGGFPVRRRPDTQLGLEVPLNIMAILARAKRAVPFNGGLFLKGFSTVFVATKRIEDCVVWHMLYNEDGSHISYTDPRVEDALGSSTKNIEMTALENARHIVGWCSNVKNYAGASNANYTIDYSHLGRPHAGCAFQKVSITAGQFVTAGFEAAIGKKDKAIHLKARDDYVSQLRWIAKKFVVLYDVDDQRGWLLDGASALLHLVRSSLQRDQDDEFRALSLFDAKDMKEATIPYTGKAAAINVLTNSENLNMKLYSKPDDIWNETTVEVNGVSQELAKRKVTYLTLKDRIQSIYHILEQIVAHQAHVDTADGVGFKVKRSPRRQLEGFDFMDVASDEDPIWPRVTSLRSMGRGWIDFTRAIHAITLFGNSFGDLITPAGSSTPCLSWATVPKSHDYLAVCVSQLTEILKKGNTKTNPWRVVDDIVWHNPDRLFEVCECEKSTHTKLCDRVQVLLPAAMQNRWGKALKSPAHLENDGAVIFGHSDSFKWFWRKHDRAEDGDLSLSTTESDFHDSGLGTSVQPTEREASSPPSHQSQNEETTPALLRSSSTFSYLNPYVKPRTVQLRTKHISRIYRKLRPHSSDAATGVQHELQNARDRPAPSISNISIDSLARNPSISDMLSQASEPLITRLATIITKKRRGRRDSRYAFMTASLALCSPALTGLLVHTET